MTTYPKVGIEIEDAIFVPTLGYDAEFAKPAKPNLRPATPSSQYEPELRPL